MLNFFNYRNIRKLKKDLVPLQKELQKIPALNSGGCALVAHAMVEYVNKNYPKCKATVVYLFTESSLYSYRNIQNNQPDSCSHAVVKIGDLYYDSDGVYTKKELIKTGYTSSMAPVDQNFVYESLKYDRWNPNFDRERYAKHITSIFRLSLDYPQQTKINVDYSL